MFQPQYKLTDSIVQALTHIAETKAIIDRAKILPKHELKLRRQALIRMILNSTQIEGNQLNQKQVEAVYAHKKVNAPLRDIYEVKNYLKALKYIEQVVKDKKPISEKVILRIHKLVTDKTLPAKQSGHYRKGPVYVVRHKNGHPSQVLYTAPDYKKVPKLTADLVEWINKSKKNNINPIIVAGAVHMEIAAIHPFIDGNGRTARALATLVLYERGYDFRRLFALEDYYNKDRPEYYKAINLGKTYNERKIDQTSWLTYFVTGFKEEIDNVKGKVTVFSSRKIDEDIDSKIYLDQDQQKILDFLDQMGRITVKDVIDILNCPRRTAQLELQKLKKLKMIKQTGKGPAAAYVLS